MHKEVMKTADQVSTRKATERLVKILDSNYSKEYLEQVATKTTHLND